VAIWAQVAYNHAQLSAVFVFIPLVASFHIVVVAGHSLHQKNPKKQI
jgi:hypothetical protein